jgi:hypothetical protein
MHHILFHKSKYFKLKSCISFNLSFKRIRSRNCNAWSTSLAEACEHRRKSQESLRATCSCTDRCGTDRGSQRGWKLWEEKIIATKLYGFTCNGNDAQKSQDHGKPLGMFNKNSIKRITQKLNLYKYLILNRSEIGHDCLCSNLYKGKN